MNREAIFLSAIRDRDGTVNVGYLFLFKVMRTFWFELGVMTAGAAIAFWAAWPKPDEMVKVLSAYGTAVGIVAAANFTTSLVGIGAFLWGDRPVASTATTTTTMTATAPASAIPATQAVSPEALIAAAGGVGPDDEPKRKPRGR